MKAIISSTYTDIYLFNLPIVTWAWNKLGVEVELFLPNFNRAVDPRKTELASMFNRIKNIHFFNCPPEKEATYAQNSRLYGACLPGDLDEILVISDCDMLVFPAIMQYLTAGNKLFSVLGKDLVPEGQLPMCYLWGTKRQWVQIMQLEGRNYQQCLDGALEKEECENMRGCLWSRDQETAAKFISAAGDSVHYYDRARPGTTFANHRCDRDDQFWEERLNKDVIDAHLWRPLWEEANFEKLMKLMRFFWPDEDFTWIREYRQNYIQLL